MRRDPISCYAAGGIEKSYLEYPFQSSEATGPKFGSLPGMHGYVEIPVIMAEKGKRAKGQSTSCILRAASIVVRYGPYRTLESRAAVCEIWVALVAFDDMKDQSPSRHTSSSADDGSDL